MNQPKIGELISGDEVRDAIHIAIAPCVAPYSLAPGDHVGVDGKKQNPVGIVDPYLLGPVKKGQKFWLFLYPNTITSLKHLWTHPEFDDPDKGAGKKWLAKVEIEKHAHNMMLSFDELMAGAKRYLATGEYMIDGGKWEGERLDESFWDSYEVYTGEHVPYVARESFFSCSC